MAKAKKLPSGSWRCQAAYTDDDGVQHRASFTEETAVLAEAKAAMWKAGMIELDRRKKHLPLGEAIDEYLETCRVTGLSPATIRSYASMRNNAYETIIRKPIDKLTLRDLQQWINLRSRTAGPKTLRNSLNLISAVLRSNGISLDFTMLKLPKRQHTEMEIPSDLQVAELLDRVYDDDNMFIAVSLAAIMGLRRSEICGLRWADVHYEDGLATLVIDKALVMGEDCKYVEKATKTNAGTRTLVIPDALYNELKRRRQLRPTLVSATPNTLTLRYKRLADELGLPHRFHNLRHYHASVMLREGVPEKYIVADMGHASFDMVKRVYGHVMQEKRRLINDAMNTHATVILNRSHGDAHEEKKAR